MKVQIILGSVRPNRVSERVAKWVLSEAGKAQGIDAEIVDLKDYPMPLFNEEASPQYNPERKPEASVKKWLNKLNQADAFIFVSPEYNRSIPGPMKNALDHTDFQFAKKPVALVTHGSVGGANALANYRIALAQLLAVTVPEVTMIIGASGVLEEDGTLDLETAANPYGPLGALNKTLESLKWYGEALKSARQKDS